MAVYLNQAKTKMLRFLGGLTDSVQITHFTVGTAPVYKPSPDQTSLKEPVFVGAITEYTQPTETTVRYRCSLGLSDCAGMMISEIGLIDEDGDLVCIKSFTPTEKTGNAEMTILVTDDFNGLDVIYLTDNENNDLTDNEGNYLTAERRE